MNISKLIITMVVIMCLSFLVIHLSTYDIYWNGGDVLFQIK